MRKPPLTKEEARQHLLRIYLTIDAEEDFSTGHIGAIMETSMGIEVLYKDDPRRFAFHDALVALSKDLPDRGATGPHPRVLKRLQAIIFDALVTTPTSGYTSV